MADEKVAPVDNSSILNLASLFLGKNTKTSYGGSTSTTQTNTESVSPEAVNALIKQMLEGTQGLAAVSQGQKTAGLYNSSTNQLMVNDLLSRTAGQAAALNKTTTVANTVADNRTQTAATAAQVSPQLGLGLVAGAQLLSSMGGISSLSKLLGLKSASDVVTPKTATAGAGAKLPADDGTTEGIQTTIDGLPGSSTGTAGNAAQGDIAQLVQQHLDTTGGYGLAGASIAPTILDQTVTAPDIGDIGVGLPTLSDSGAVADFGTDIGADFGGDYDVSGMLDYSGATADLPGSILDEFSFAKGGLVPKGYADGGQVSDAQGRTTSEDRPVLDLVLALTRLVSMGKIDETALDASGRRKGTADIRVPISASADMAGYGLAGQSFGNIVGLSDERKRLFAKGLLLDSVGNPITKKGNGYAEGGLVNTGLRPTATSRPTGLGVDASVVDAVVKSITPTPNQSTPLAQKNTAAVSTRRVNPATASNSGNTSSAGNSSTPGVGTTPGASSSGLGTNPTGLSLGLSSLGVSAPGLAGIASASNNTSAVNSAVSGGMSSIGGLVAGLPGALVSGLVTSLLMSQANAGTPSTPGSVAAANANNAAANTGMDPMDAMMAFLGATAQGDSTTPGVSTEGGIGVGTGDGGSVGTDGDGGAGAGAAMKGGGKVPGDDPTHSDTVEANLTAGEFVINRNATQMFRPILEMINNMVPATPMAARK